MLISDNTVTIPLLRYEELIKKEFVYDLKREEIKNSKYSNSVDRKIYRVPEEELTDDV